MDNENKRLKRKVRYSYFISTISIAMVLFLLGSVGFLIASTVETARSLKESVTLIVELDREILTQEQRNAIGEQISAKGGDLVLDITFVTKEQKRNDEAFREWFDVEFEDVFGEDDNPLLDSFDVRVAASGGDNDRLRGYIDELTCIEGVEHVSYPAAMVETMQSALSKIEPLLIIFAVVLAVISLVLLNSTIRLAIFSKRYVINTMKLVGATKWFITKPFILNSIGQGVVAGILASLLFGLAFWGAGQSLPELFTPERCMTAGIVATAMIVTGITVSTLFTLFAVNKFVNMKSNKIHLY